MARRRITIDMDEELLAIVDKLAVEMESSRNRLVADAIRELVRSRARERVDREFERMATDASYQAELMQIERQAAKASDSAWKHLDGSGAQPRKAPGGRRRGAAHATR